MTKVTLLGDSIRMFYGKRVVELLGNNYDVFQPEENCRFSKYTLRGLYQWKEGIDGSDIIHWNNGLWDCTYCVDGVVFSSLDEYITNMLRIGKILKQRAKEVIFATTTPVIDTSDYNKNGTIIEYNNAIVPELKAIGIKINDLHSIIYPQYEKYISNDLVHPNEAGVAVLADKVVTAIKEAEMSICK